MKKTGSSKNLVFIKIHDVTSIKIIIALSRIIVLTPARSYKLTLRRLMSYIYGAPILDVSRSHTTTQHSQ